MIESETMDRLYLQCDRSRTVYVDLYKPLQPHQIDGIRFLYKQYRKKSPGVILNDPQGYGKCVQVALFLRALRPYLKKPVLILTQTVAVWKIIFEEWTDIGWEVGVLEPQPFSPTHKIFVNPVDDGFNFVRRDWSVVVLHNSDIIDNTKDYLRMKFNVQYQIWITSNDMKENLRTLAMVYEWLHPKQKFNIDAFTTQSEDWKDKIQKLIFLDAFLENVILRRSDFANLFMKQFMPPLLTPQLKTTRKNKDPTGTKVKRSKRLQIEDEDNAVDVAIKKVVTNNEPTEKADVEDFIANENPITTKNDQSPNTDNDDSMNVTVDEKGESNLNFSNVFNLMPKLDEDNRVNTVETEENTAEVEHTHDNADENVETKVLVPETEDIENVEENKDVTIIAETEESEDTQLYENDTLKLDSDKNDSKTNVNENGTKESINVAIDNDITNDNENEFKESFDNLTKDSINNAIADENKNDGNELKASFKNEVTKDRIKEKPDNKVLERKVVKVENDLEDELAVFEANALKKFKGSYLDRLF